MDKQSINRKHYIAIVLALIAGVAVLLFTHQRKRYWADAGMVWNTEYHMNYETKVHLTDSIQAVLNSIDMSASPYNANSLITRVNNNQAEVLDEILRKLYLTSVDINKASEGAYDPTVMPLVNAWGFGYKKGQLPTDEQIDSILQFVGISKTQLNGQRLIKEDPRIQLDFSSIAKGLACDEMGRMFERAGASNYMIEIGGEVLAHGVNSRGTDWHISIDLPLDEDSTVNHQSALVVAITDEAVATSGNYRKFKMINGQKVSHIIDPLTGRSCTSNLLSVTIIANDCMTADAWATACMVMGLERVQRMMKERTDLGVMTISSDDNGNYVVWSNQQFANHVIQ